MLNPYSQRMIAFLKANDFNYFTGVPCSNLDALFQHALQTNTLYNALNEGDAVAFASGSYLCKKNTVILMTNAGLGNAISPITSLSALFKIPLLFFISYRGGQADEPQHLLMGEMTVPILNLLSIDYEWLDENEERALQQIACGLAAIAQQKSFALLVKHEKFKKPATPFVLKNQRPSRFEYLQMLLPYLKQSVVITTTGFSSRETFELQDTANHFYMVGSMGCAPALGLGIARSTDRALPVVVLDGDGALLMRLNNMAFVGIQQPDTYLHILFDNGCYESTGGQATDSEQIDWLTLAKAMSYKTVLQANTITECETHLLHWLQKPTLTFLYIRVSQCSKNPSRVSRAVLNGLKQRFMQYYQSIQGGR